jgi:hypothetical protein
MEGTTGKVHSFVLIPRNVLSGGYGLDKRDWSGSQSGETEDILLEKIGYHFNYLEL